MELEYELREEDYINFNVDHAKNSSSLKKNIMVQRLMGPVLFLMFPFIIRKNTEIPMWYWFSIFGIISVLWIVFYPKYINWEMSRRAAKMLKEGNNESLLRSRKIQISEQGIFESSACGESNVGWNLVNRIGKTKDYIYIYISSVSAYIIPMRVFKDEEEKKLFIKELSKYGNCRVD